VSSKMNYFKVDRRCLLVVGTFSLIIPSASRSQSVQTVDQAAVSLNAGTGYSPSELVKLERDAVDGSPEAALSLGRSYALNNGPSDEALHWLSIAVENGSKDAMYDLGVYLALRSDPLYKERAKYWLKRVIREGSPDDQANAKTHLEYIDEGKR